MRSSQGATSVAFRRLRLRFCDFDVMMCAWNAFSRLILPEPVILNRFLAPDFVFILGMSLGSLT
jgi:hypothetical protein